ncbi:flagellin [Pelosinus sp. sgz500959]|uniref:flagellin N-terminal helical domain-containing protein n=1 Tax=Pelosinus sp. sgz500959 TaxID=3242472 RepID=UPI00366ACAA0
MIINHNMTAVNTLRQMGVNENNSTKSLQKLSSGLRINGAADDAAGLAISEKMRAQIRGLDQSTRNAQDGISMVQTAEGALNETHSILQRVRELADQSANGTNTADDRTAMQTEVKQLTAEIDRIGNDTEFNTKKLLNGSLNSSSGIVGANNTTGTAVAKMVAATNTSIAVTSGMITDTILAKEETINIDGTDIKVNWASLSDADKTFLKTTATANADTTAVAKATQIITDAINAAIDSSGKNVAHITGSNSGTSGLITLQSGTQGVDSKVDTSSATGGVMATLFTHTAGTVGTSTYNGTSTANVADLKVNGVLMSVSLASVATGGTTAMTTAATALATAINASIATVNAATGKIAGQEGFIKDVSVVATNDGKFSISSDSGPVELTDRAGNTDVADLGLSSAQTSAAGSGGMSFQIGANKNQMITFGIKDMRSAAIGISGVDVSSQTSASSALTTLDAAIKKVSAERSNLGAIQNRLEHTINNLGTSSENLTAAESRIRDVDMAKEMTAFKKSDILNQASQAMLAQANQQPQGVLQLLR